MISSLENWGQLKFTTFNEDSKNNEKSDATSDTFLQLLSLPKGKEKGSPQFVSRPIVSIPISSIVSASGTTKNDVSIVMRPNTSATGPNSGLELISFRFAVPDVCVGYEQTEEAGKVILAELQDQMKAYQQQFLKSHHPGSEENNLLILATMNGTSGTYSDEVVVAIFDDVQLSYPSGKYKIIISNYNVVLEDKKKGTTSGILSFPITNLQQLYLCDVPTYFSRASSNDVDSMVQYVVLVLKKPLKVRSTTYTNLVISCPPKFVLDEDHPWRCELKTQSEINTLLGLTEQANEVDYPLVPSMCGRVCDIIVRTFKAISKVPAYGGINKEYTTILTQHLQSCMRCLFHGAEGLLYIVSGGFLFLHRPATRIPYKEVTMVNLNESNSGSATFQITVFTAKDRYVFSGLDKIEKDGLMQYLGNKVKVQRIGMSAEEEDVDDDDDDDDDNDDEELEEDDEEDDSDSGKSDSVLDDSETRSHKHHRKEKSEKKHSKDKNSSKHRKKKHKHHHKK
ncbi:unnamed protein product [Phytomonas sp. Hart1]|nr:unnamed protein product [Phytomonas sp. Hart1]|eukprot:CCW70524.1 unnamed protein product [Phytomonas sp. isolate Hart1]